MGIPYSREINAAFEQVTPLVAAGFKVLRTTKNISILLAAIQVLTVLCLFLILLTLIALLYSVNPDLEDERQRLVTPFFIWLARVSVRGAMVGFLLMMMAGGVGVVGAWFVWQNRKDDLEVVGEDGDQDIAEDEKDSKEGKKKGKKGRKNENVENEEEGNGKKKNAK